MNRIHQKFPQLGHQKEIVVEVAAVAAEHWQVGRTNQRHFAAVGAAGRTNQNQNQMVYN